MTSGFDATQAHWKNVPNLQNSI